MPQLSEIHASATIVDDISSFLVQWFNGSIIFGIYLYLEFFPSWWKLSKKLSLKLPHEVCERTWDNQSKEGQPLFISFSSTSPCKELVFPPTMDLLLTESWRNLEAGIFL